MPELSQEQKEKRVSHFKRVIKYRSLFGWIFAFVGGSLFVVGLQADQNLMVVINGALFFGYGLFMVRQSKKALKNLSDRTS